MFTTIKKSMRNRGFTLAEVLVYAGGLIVVLAAMVSFLYYMYNWYQTATVGPRADQAGIYLVSKIEEDIRGADSVNTGSSVFGVAAGAISVTATNGSNSTTTLYYLSGSRIASQVNSGGVLYVSPSDMTVTAFYVNQATTTESSAVRFEIDIAYHTRQGTTTGMYPGLAILRGSYQ
jgi:hypothetical protein